MLGNYVLMYFNPFAQGNVPDVFTALTLSDPGVFFYELAWLGNKARLHKLITSGLPDHCLFLGMSGKWPPVNLEERSSST